MITEELITIAAATLLSKKGWEIIAVHPPDGQGPFTIPRGPQTRDIERASYHPDIVAICKDKLKTSILILECKVNRDDLASDVEKFNELTQSPESLYYICFRCQQFEGGPENSVDFNKLSKIDYKKLPIEFGFAYQSKTGSLILPKMINDFTCIEYSFDDTDLIK